LDRLDGVGLALEAGIRDRLDQVRHVGTEWSTLLQGLSSGSSEPALQLMLIIATVVLSAAVFHGFRLLLARNASWPGRSPSIADFAAAVLTLMLVLLMLRLGLADGTERHIARVWCYATVLGILVMRLFKRLILSASHHSLAPSLHLASFARLLIAGSAWGLFGVATTATLRAWNAGPGIRDLVGTFLVSVPVTVLLILAYWRHRKAVTAVVAGPQPHSPWRKRFAETWPALAILALIGTFLALQVAATLKRPLPGLAMLGTLLLVLVAPHVDSAIAAWVARKDEARTGSLISATLRRMARFAFAILVAGLLTYLWALPGFTSLGFDVTLIQTKAVGIVLVMLVAACLWSATAAGTERLWHAREHAHNAVTDEEASTPQTRLETLLPLLVGTAKISILVLSVLTILIILDVNVWPLITGLSVFGLAIGFGSQTLVKDIVSGLFFLLDDSFRMGEYIETSGAKGTVEKISIRSVSLRHPRGAVATIPYGQIGKIQNFSRDWVIEKLAFRVAFDTDVEKVRKLFKQIGQDIASDPELKVDLMEPFKSQGIASVEDGTLLIRGKFKAKAGRQFAIRKAVLSAVQSSFRENGIRAVPKPISASDETAGAK
jgi:moderate conductance mechanosensitive channel